MPVGEKRLLQQGIRQLLSTGRDRQATEVLVVHIMLVSPGADRQRMLQERRFEENGKLGTWILSYCKISKLPPSFGALVCSGALVLDNNYLESLPDSFSDIIVGAALSLSDNKLQSVPARFSDVTVAGKLYLHDNPQLTGVPENFPNVKGCVYR